MKVSGIFVGLILLLLVCFCLGQGQSLQETTVVYRPNMFGEGISELLELYKIYETRCWDDSTLIITAGSSTNYRPPISVDSLGRKFIDMTEIITMNADYQIKRNWIHKEPTFKGFVAWLREQDKQ